uniref:Rho-GAP domain-containing protein n=1 Tax=Romanomermis culicivorax TaxID=13658 RepID=A0A915JPW8_ROMCU
MIPCIPRGTPSKNQKCKIVDFVSQVPPMIPHVLIHCINEIERRGLDSIGLYRIPGTETKVNELLNNFLWGKGVPNLRLIDDVNTIAGCIKRFLQQLKEPIIPTTSWLDFVRAASAKDEHGRYDNQALHRAIAELPMPNKDTLSFLILHFQRVASMKESNKMSAENLAKVFGPSIVGYSSEQVDLARGLEEASKQEMVIISLLSLPSDYWNRLVNWGDTMPLIIEPSLFETRPAYYKQLRFDSETKLYPCLAQASPRTPNNAAATLPSGTPCGNFNRSKRKCLSTMDAYLLYCPFITSGYFQAACWLRGYLMSSRTFSFDAVKLSTNTDKV